MITCANKSHGMGGAYVTRQASLTDPDLAFPF